jgi:hypothetical protein
MNLDVSLIDTCEVVPAVSAKPLLPTALPL